MLPFFPFPTVTGGNRARGYRRPWPAQCERCDRQCERRPTATVALCSYGVNYIWPEPDVLVFGVVLRDYPSSSAARTRVLRRSRDLAVGAAELDLACMTLRNMRHAFQASVSQDKQKILEEYRASRGHERDLLNRIKSDLQRAFAVLHDYRQFIGLVRQNLNVILESRYRGRPLEEQLAAALPSEKAIYWASRLMAEKLETAFLLLQPERITDPSSIAKFRLHGAVHKYLQIYGPAFAEKEVAVRTFGTSTGLVLGNPAACGVIPHTLIDNALKYSPRKTEVIVSFMESASHITLSVTSQGPRIDPDETKSIFDIFFRGRHAQQQEEVGAGFGLYLAQLIAREMRTEIKVTQSAVGSEVRGYETTFSVTFERAG